MNSFMQNDKTLISPAMVKNSRWRAPHHWSGSACTLGALILFMLGGKSGHAQTPPRISVNGSGGNVTVTGHQCGPFGDTKPIQLGCPPVTAMCDASCDGPRLVKASGSIQAGGSIPCQSGPASVVGQVSQVHARLDLTVHNPANSKCTGKAEGFMSFNIINVDRCPVTYTLSYNRNPIQKTGTPLNLKTLIRIDTPFGILGKFCSGSLCSSGPQDSLVTSGALGQLSFEIQASCEVNGAEQDGASATVTVDLTIDLVRSTDCPASTFLWSNPAGGDFGAADNWSEHDVPGAADTAVFTLIGNSASPVLVQAANNAVGRLFITGMPVIFNGSLSVTKPSANQFGFRVEAR